jgi:hypothetical protein
VKARALLEIKQQHYKIMESKALAKRNSKMEVVPPSSPTPLALLEQALAKGVDLDQMQKLMDLQERWEKKEAKKAFFNALTNFQALVPVIKKNKRADIKSDKGSYSYKYAELGNVEAQIKSAMEKCKLTKRWEIDEEGGLLKVKCLITHIEGHTEITEMKAEKDSTGGKNVIQQKASTITYLKRYTLLGGLGISTADEDNDGKSHSAPQPEQPRQTDDEVLAQWQQSVDGCSSRVELNGLYVKNRKAVDGNPKVQAIFKARQEQLPPVKTTTLP